MRWRKRCTGSFCRTAVVSAGATSSCFDGKLLSGNLPKQPAADSTMVGILVHGDNHFIVRGPMPDRESALALVRHWSIIQIGAGTPSALDGWRIVSREFRENLEWAVAVPGDGEKSPAVATLLDELAARGIRLLDFRP
jgi:hypothetical protein